MRRLPEAVRQRRWKLTRTGPICASKCLRFHRAFRSKSPYKATIPVPRGPNRSPEFHMEYVGLPWIRASNSVRGRFPKTGSALHHLGNGS